jgi:hypothetical protein
MKEKSGRRLAEPGGGRCLEIYLGSLSEREKKVKHCSWKTELSLVG